MWAQIAIDTTGYTGTHLILARRSSKKYDAGESFKIRWSVGSGWNDLIVSSGDGWDPLTVNLPAAADNNPNLKLRFKSYGSQANEWGDVDDLAFMGWQ